MSEVLTQIILSLSKFSKNLDGFNLFKTDGVVLLTLFFVVVVFLIAFSLGKTRILIGILSIYVAAFLQSIFPFDLKIKSYFDNSSWFSLPSGFWVDLAVFLILFLVSVAILSRSVLKPKMSLQESSAFTILFLSIFISGFLVSVGVSYLSPDFLPPIVLKYFGTSNARFIWAVLPLLAMVFLKRKKAA